MSVALTVRDTRTGIIRLVGDSPRDLWQHALRTYPDYHMSSPSYDRGCWRATLKPLEQK